MISGLLHKPPERPLMTQKDRGIGEWKNLRLYHLLQFDQVSNNHDEGSK